jgi:hypothetical protein
MAIPLEPVSLGESTAIRVRYFLGRSRRAEGRRILLIRYDGTCRSGDDGESDGRFMLAMGKAGLTAWEPDGLVVDLTDLDCRQLVDGLTSLLYLGEGFFGSENLPQAVVVGPWSAQAVRTFFLDINAGCRVEAVQESFHDIETAIDRVEEAVVKSYSLFSGKPRRPSSPSSAPTVTR